MGESEEDRQLEAEAQAARVRFTSFRMAKKAADCSLLPFASSATFSLTTVARCSNLESDPGPGAVAGECSRAVSTLQYLLTGSLSLARATSTYFYIV